MAALITLTTDFGAGSGFPAQMKAVILRAIPGAVLVDVSHEVPAYDVLAGALLLEACLPWFPDDAVHCAVVDPGVGTPRSPLVVVDGGGRRLVGPDNGLFTPFLDASSAAFEIVKVPLASARRSATFHGRDVFAPTAAWLAQGGDPSSVGPRVNVPVTLSWPAASFEGGAVRGECLAADPFGNVVTSLRERDLRGGTVLSVSAAGHPARWVTTFGEGAPGELLALVGSGGRVELAVREGSAARAHRLVRGAPVRVVLAEAG